MKDFERVLPEEAGIPSICISNFINRLYNRKIPLHSMMLMRNNKLIAEHYYYPCNEETLHRMFSISKSVTALAIFLLIKEGKLSMDDNIVDFFKEFCGDSTNIHPFIKEMTIRDMLMMRTCFDKTTYKLNSDSGYVASFFTTAPSHKPGSVFHYDTSSAHVLAALVEKITHKELHQYIKEELAILNFSEESYFLKDPEGVSMGGSGLVAKTSDLLKLGYLLINDGIIDNKEILPSIYIKEATSHLSSTCITGPVRSECSGYGMMFWCTEKNGFVAYGMGGQLIIVHKDLDLVLITTADTQGISNGNQEIYDSLYEEIFPYLDNIDYLSAGKNITKISLSPNVPVNENNVANNVFIPDDGYRNTALENSISGKTFVIENDSKYKRVKLTFSPSGDNGDFEFEYDNTVYHIPFGINSQVEATLPLYGFYCTSSGTWLKDNSYYIKVNVIDSSVGNIHLQFSFIENKLVLFMKKVEETMLEEYSGHLNGYLQ